MKDRNEAKAKRAAEAKAAYDKKMAEVKDLLLNIQGKLEGYEEEDTANGINYAHVGSLEHIEDLLLQVNHFMG